MISIESTQKELHLTKYLILKHNVSKNNSNAYRFHLCSHFQSVYQGRKKKDVTVTADSGLHEEAIQHPGLHEDSVPTSFFL
jgi:hypothetical protein